MLNLLACLNLEVLQSCLVVMRDRVKVVDEEGAGKRILARDLRCLMEGFAPYFGCLDRLCVNAAAANDAAGSVPRKQWVEGRLRILAMALVPQLHADFLTFDLHDLELKVAVALVGPVSRFLVRELTIVVHELLDDGGLAGLGFSYDKDFLHALHFIC